MKILFFTKSKKYTLLALKKMVAMGHTVTVVFKSMDICTGTEMKEYCDAQGIQYVFNNDLYGQGFFQSRMFDLGITNTYGRLIKEEAIYALKGRIFNIHCAPLPKYKGLYAYNWGIYNGELSWCVTAHYVNDKFDEGEIIREVSFPIDPNVVNVKWLEEESQKYGCELTLELLQQFENGGMPEGKKQEGNGHYYSMEDFEQLKRVEESYSAQEIERRIKACYCPGYEGAYLNKDGMKFHFMSMENNS